MTDIALHHILLKSPLLAEDILNELSLGARFEDLANEHSACPSGKQQGFAGFHDGDRLPPELYQALLDYDGTSPWIGPVRTRYGYHVIRPAGQIGENRVRIDDPDAVSSESEH
ncbi:peptidylprolyl isomerase [Thalassolituus sp.]|uniref:peptidylprolyl isomerase n=1 Tax=Thalassolituus sp. TaxID=2030822 RepID=UPI00260B471F|nr:peptidylprolyl isomerase [uncultured Thalassolituus sp.]